MGVGNEGARRLDERAAQVRQARAVLDARTAAPARARALLAALLEPWFPGGDPDLLGLACDAIFAFDAPLDAGARATLAAAVEPRTDGDLFEQLCARYEGAAPAPEAPPLLFAVAELRMLGERLVALERQGWGSPDAVADARVAASWTRVTLPSVFPSPEEVAATFEAPLMQVLDGVLREAGLAELTRLRAREEARQELGILLFSSREGPPGWRDVALRMVELDPRGPLRALAEALGARGRQEALRCLATRGHWPSTLDLLGPGLAGAEALADRGPLFFEDLAGLHVIRRLLCRWRDGALHPRASWATVRTNRASLRGRLRAKLADRPGEALLPMLLEAPGLAARTDRALRGFGLVWAWNLVRTHLQAYPGDAPLVPCAAPPDDAPARVLDPALLRTWVLLVTLRGHDQSLERWLRRVRPAPGGATWGRLLTDELPAGLRDPPRRGRPHAELREALGLQLAELRAELAPALDAVSRLPDGRAASEAFAAAVREVWHPDVPLPKRGFASIREEARRALALAPVVEDE